MRFASLRLTCCGLLLSSLFCPVSWAEAVDYNSNPNANNGNTNPGVVSALESMASNLRQQRSSSSNSLLPVALAAASGGGDSVLPLALAATSGGNNPDTVKQIVLVMAIQEKKEEEQKQQRAQQAAQLAQAAARAAEAQAAQLEQQCKQLAQKAQDGDGKKKGKCKGPSPEQMAQQCAQQVAQLRFQAQTMMIAAVQNLQAANGNGQSNSSALTALLPALLQGSNAPPSPLSAASVPPALGTIH